jgi:cell fate (sporulation/competence/biofilm development) regulator YmcA (YheA/YmcA/DUF963 family)
VDVRANPGVAKPTVSPILQRVRDAAAKREAEAKQDPFEESERVRKALAREFPPGAKDEDGKLPWTENIDELQRQLDETFKKEMAVDTSFVTNFHDAAEKVEQTNDVFGTVNEMMNSGFEALHQKMLEERELLKQRVALVHQIRDEVMKHGAETFSADLEGNDDPNADLDAFGGLSRASTAKL